MLRVHVEGLGRLGECRINWKELRWCLGTYWLGSFMGEQESSGIGNGEGTWGWHVLPTSTPHPQRLYPAEGCTGALSAVVSGLLLTEP